MDHIQIIGRVMLVLTKPKMHMLPKYHVLLLHAYKPRTCGNHASHNNASSLTEYPAIVLASCYSCLLGTKCLCLLAIIEFMCGCLLHLHSWFFSTSWQCNIFAYFHIPGSCLNYFLMTVTSFSDSVG